MDKEVFKDIPGYEGLYQVSNLGNVKSIERYVKHCRGGNQILRGRMLKFNSNKNGYLRVGLNKEGCQKGFKIHQLVAMAFLDHKPCGMKLVINHINHINTDNRVENLEITTQRENTNKKHINSSSKYVGVFWNKNINRWDSRINIKGKLYYLGKYKTEYEAHLAYQNKLKTL